MPACCSAGMSPGAEAVDLAGLEAALGVRFVDRGLLLAAVTHRSYLNEVEAPDSGDNERLEFLGDALVDFVAADLLFRHQPEAREGEMTALRAALVCEPALAAFARRIGLGAYLRLGRGEAATGGRDRSGALGDAFEAVIGALYLDQGLPAVEAFVTACFLPELEALLARRRYKDAKSTFQELAQRAWQVTPEYRTAAESGPDHAKWFVVSVHLAGVEWGVGEGPSKAEAARVAAAAAIERMRVERPEAFAGD
jgi:ribonuclease III